MTFRVLSRVHFYKARVCVHAPRGNPRGSSALCFPVNVREALAKAGARASLQQLKLVLIITSTVELEKSVCVFQWNEKQ